MKTIAILYSSTHGQTKKISYFMRDFLIARGLGVQVFCLDTDSPDLEFNGGMDGVIVGGPVYIGKYGKKLVSWVKANRAELKIPASAFFSVSLNAADRRPASRLDDARLLKEFFRQTGWTPDYAASIAGAIKYKEYNWIVRRLLRWISSSAEGPTDTALNHELTDWNMVESFLQSFLSGDANGLFSTRSLIDHAPRSLPV